jgi:hypothetical protein
MPDSASAHRRRRRDCTPRMGNVPSAPVRAPTTSIAAFSALALVACSTPGLRMERVGSHGATSLDGRQGIILAAGGSRPPPKPPPVPPRPPGRVNQRNRQNEPVGPEHVPGRRLAGPPDAPYWESVLEIPWGGAPLQGPRPAPPPRASGQAAEPAPPAPGPPLPQPAQPPSRPAIRPPEPGRPAAEGAGRGGTKLKPDPAAPGPHTTFKRDPQTGRVTSHAEWDAAGPYEIPR